MYNSYNDEIFDTILTNAFNMYWDEESASMPSDEELAKMYPIPEKQVKQVQRYARRLEHKTSKAIVFLRRFAVACLVILSLTLAVYAVSPTVREIINNAVITWYEKYVQFDFSKVDSDENNEKVEDEPTDIYDLHIGYIPEGYELVSSTEEIDFREYIYLSPQESTIFIGIYYSEHTNVLADIELTDCETLIINNVETYLFYNPDENHGMLIWGNDVFSICISATVDKASILNIAENITTEPKEETEEITDIYDLYIGYIPEGFELVSSTEERDFREYMYLSQTDDYLIINIYQSDYTSIGMDIELAEYQLLS